MEEITKNAFRTAMGGYNKKDVNDYITALSERYDKQVGLISSHLDTEVARCEELECRIKMLERELQLRPAEAADKAALDQAQAMVTARTEQVDALSAERDEYKNALESANRELAAAKKELDVQAKELAEAKTALEALDRERAQLAEYEQMKSKMGELYLEAVASTNRMRTEAEEYAAKRRADSDAELEAYRANEFNRIADVFVTLKDELTALIDSYRKKAEGFAPAEPSNEAKESAQDAAAAAALEGFGVEGNS